VLLPVCPRTHTTGVYSADLRKHYDLRDPAWRYDIQPELVDGHNLAGEGGWRQLGVDVCVCVWTATVSGPWCSSEA
jgi:hypothetical protein